MIIVTGAKGFIGSCLIRKLNDEGYDDIVLVDNFSNNDKNLINKKYSLKIERNKLHKWLHVNNKSVEFLFHMGAKTDTTIKNKNLLNKLNLEYSKIIFNICTKYDIPLVYASSAATYGLGEHGYIDDHKVIYKLKPLNLYGESKNEFDKFVVSQVNKPNFWAGLKFFNIYGPNEYHKGKMASVIFHSFNQIKKEGVVKLFKSYNNNFKDGEQKRDFVYVKDVIDVCYYFMNNCKNSGIYNVGTGKARTFLDLVKCVFNSLGKEEKIEFIDMPKEIRKNYQYFTQADVTKLRNIGYKKAFYDIESGIEDYIKNHLLLGEYY